MNSPTCETPKGLTAYALPYSNFPYFLYDYKLDGTHTGEQEIENEVHLIAVFDIIIPTAMKQHRKLVILDHWGQCIFHAEEGWLIFPRRDMYQMMVDNDIERLNW